MNVPIPGEALRRRQVADLEAMLPAFVDRSPPARLAEERLRALWTLRLVVLEPSPRHRKRLAGVDPARFPSGARTAKADVDVGKARQRAMRALIEETKKR